MHILYYAINTLDKLYNLFSRTIIILVLCRKLAADASNSYVTCQIQYISVRQPVRTIADYGRLKEICCLLKVCVDLSRSFIVEG